MEMNGLHALITHFSESLQAETQIIPKSVCWALESRVVSLEPCGLGVAARLKSLNTVRADCPVHRRFQLSSIKLRG
jgi:hypothetical protein